MRDRKGQDLSDVVTTVVLNISRTEIRPSSHSSFINFPVTFEKDVNP